MKLAKKKIVVVDDSKVFLLLFKEILTKEGMEVLTAFNAKEGLELIKTERPDVILTDYEMPEMSGREMCTVLKADDELKEIPIIMLTSRQEESDIIASVDAGADDYLFKSYGHDVILMKIRAMLRISELKREVVELHKVKAMQSLVVAMSHEFNNVLGIVVGYINLLDKKTNLQEVHEFQRLKGPLLRLADLIRNVRSLKSFKLKKYIESSEEPDMLDIMESSQEHSSSRTARKKSS